MRRLLSALAMITISGSVGSATTVALGPQGIPGPAGKDGKDGKPGEPGIPGKDGKDGENGKPGIPGKDGKDGEDGKPGEPGRPGKDGKDGENGKPGEPGKDGKDGENGKPGEPGKDGKDGENGKPGEPGRPGKDGKDGENGKPGEPGRPGKDGENGKPGEPGRPGKDGKDGENGKPGEPGKDGKDGENGENGDGLNSYETDLQAEINRAHKKISTAKWEIKDKAEFRKEIDEAINIFNHRKFFSNKKIKGTTQQLFWQTQKFEDKYEFSKNSAKRKFSYELAKATKLYSSSFENENIKLKERELIREQRKLELNIDNSIDIYILSTKDEEDEVQIKKLQNACYEFIENTGIITE